MALQVDVRQHIDFARPPASLAAPTASPASQGRGEQASSASAKISDFYRWLIGSSSKEAAQALPDQQGSEQGSAEDAAAVRPNTGAEAGPGTSESAREQQRPQGKRLGGGNLGFQLLQRAGWQQGQGLGASGQGRTQPVPAWLQAGRSGIGMAPVTLPPLKPAMKPAQQASCREQQQQQQQQETELQHQQGKQATAAAAAQPARAPKREWDTVKVEEDVQAKVKRVRQAWQADRDNAEGKEIQRLLYRALREAPGDANISDSSPLLRSSHRLRSRNPLL